MMIPLLPCALGILLTACDFACALTVSSHDSHESIKSKGALNLIADVAATPSTPTEQQLDALLTNLQTQSAEISFDYQRLSKANDWFYLSVNLVLATVFAGYFCSLFMKSYFPALYPAPDRPSMCVFASLLSIYGLLIAGWFTDLFADIELRISLFGHSILLTSYPPGHLNAITSSTVGLMGLLPPAAAAFTVTCEMVLPMAALILFIVGEVLRHGTNPSASRRCTLISQHLIKMCCPLMFAYILGLHIFVHMQHGQVATEGVWDVGFTNFCIFCIGLTIASCFFKPAEIEMKIEESRRWFSWSSNASSRRDILDPSAAPWLLRRFGKKGTFYAALCLTVLFMAAVSIGMAFECIGIYLTPYIFMEPHGPIPDKFFPLIKDNIENIVGPGHSALDSLTTVISSSTMLVFTGGEANGAMAFVAIFGFAFICPLANMLIICAAAYKVAKRRLRDNRRVVNDDGSYAIGDIGGEAAYVAHHFKHCDMLDACIVGIFLLVLASAGEGDEGFCVFSQWAIALLILAEIIHYFAFYTVVPVAEFMQSNPDYVVPASVVPPRV